ncbi:type II toxin-antitoxin system VapC family toxin [Umezawaea endophytica]|uniref:Ribonuclease VapC n=1 Tax=Umezawaea endophytica TaxID=1654476 RepID=A0A9X2VV22_9PSEU|nr:type II toxin-antitoxin system VapC family toxin [Umezawaea endophytica]MCS7482737.1 type II toxin-antitoxin system VapC family toxin [Umezawaea endophytica]
MAPVTDRILLDTCVVIRLEEIDFGDLVDAEPAISAVTVAELAYGLDIDDPVERFARTERYYAALEMFEVLPFDTAAAKIYGTLAALVRRSGRSARPRRMDLQIAATAAANGMPVLTQNFKDFIGLERAVKVVAV